MSERPRLREGESKKCQRKRKLKTRGAVYGVFDSPTPIKQLTFNHWFYGHIFKGGIEEN